MHFMYFETSLLTFISNKMQRNPLPPTFEDYKCQITAAAQVEKNQLLIFTFSIVFLASDF